MKSRAFIVSAAKTSCCSASVGGEPRGSAASRRRTRFGVGVGQHVGVLAPELDRPLHATRRVLGRPHPRQRRRVLTRVGPDELRSSDRPDQLHRQLRRQNRPGLIHERRQLYVMGVVTDVLEPERHQASPWYDRQRKPPSGQVGGVDDTVTTSPWPDACERLLDQPLSDLTRSVRRRDVGRRRDGDVFTADHPAFPSCIQGTSHENSFHETLSVSSFPTHQRRRTSADRFNIIQYKQILSKR